MASNMKTAVNFQDDLKYKFSIQLTSEVGTHALQFSKLSTDKICLIEKRFGNFNRKEIWKLILRSNKRKKFKR